MLQLANIKTNKQKKWNRCYSVNVNKQILDKIKEKNENHLF